MNVIIEVPDGVASALIKAAEEQDCTLDGHIRNILQSYIESKQIAEAAEAISKSKEVETEQPPAPVNQEKPAPLTNDTTTVFNKPKEQGQGAPLYCKKETNSWKIL